MPITAPSVRASFAFVAVALVCLGFADIGITTFDPWVEMGRMALGAVTPDFLGVEGLVEAMVQTVAFALVGLGISAVAGFGLALVYRFGPVRWACAFLRGIHELFWALIFLQMFGLTALTGLLAIALPYSATFAKVYSEILEEADPAPLKSLPPGAGYASGFFFARLPGVWQHLRTYTSYRFECALRSTAVLGFVGLPTLGYHLETAFKQGQYAQVAALLYVFYLLISSLRLWLRPRLLPFLLVGAAFVLPSGPPIHWANAVRFFTSDIVPRPLRIADSWGATTWQELGRWLSDLVITQALPGAVATLVLTQIALVATGVLTLAFFPLICRKFFGPVGRAVGHLLLVVTRSTPEYILTFVFLQMWGPSMLPAILALALHNGAIIAHLTGRHADAIPARVDSPRGLNLYGYEILPRVYGQFLAFLFYRWEVIMRETAILGILGIHTLGFFIDSALADIRLDRVVALLLVTALLNMGVDALSRAIRSRLKLTTTPDEV